MPSLPKTTTQWFWQPSRRLAGLNLTVLSLACLAVLLSAAPDGLKVSIGLLLVVQAADRVVQLFRNKHPAGRRGLRYTAHGWQLWSAHSGWQAVHLADSSMAIRSWVWLCS